MYLCINTYLYIMRFAIASATGPGRTNAASCVHTRLVLCACACIPFARTVRTHVKLFMHAYAIHS